MKIGVAVKIDVTKILKERLFKGEKGVYLDLTTFIDTETADQYENHGFISQSITKEEREAGGVKTPILGNCRVFFRGESKAQTAQGYDKGTEAARAAMAPDFGDFDQDIPF
jgi:hypothetical protein